MDYNNLAIDTWDNTENQIVVYKGAKRQKVQYQSDEETYYDHPDEDEEEEREQRLLEYRLDNRDNLRLTGRYKREKKFKDFTWDNLDIWQNRDGENFWHCESNIQFLSHITVGTNINQRVGRIITVDSIEIKGVISNAIWKYWNVQSTHHACTGQCCRMSLLLDMNKLLYNHYPDAPHGVKDIYTEEDPWAFKRVDIEQKVLTLWEESFVFPIYSAESTPDSEISAYNVHKYIKTNFQTVYMFDGDDVIQSYGKNGILLTLTNNTIRYVGSTKEYRNVWSGSVRIRFHEPHKRDYEYPND